MTRERNWIEKATIYEVYPLTFRYGQKDGGGADPHYGNLRGIIQKLDYIQSLNVDAVWLTPIFLSPLKDGFGYNVCDYKTIHPLIGDDADFDRLVHEAHARGIKIILDLVFSHTSNQHEWFIESSKSRDNSYSDFYVWADPSYDSSGARQPPNNWLSMDLEMPSGWKWCESRRQYYLHSFNRTMPSLNIANPAVEAQLLDIARYWLNRGVDGFRMDALSHIGHDPQLTDNPIRDPKAGYHGQDHKYTTARPEALTFLKKLRALIDTYPPRTLPNAPYAPYRPALLGEVMNAPDFATKLIQGNVLDIVFNGNLTGTLINYRQVVEEICNSGCAARTAWAMSNHDTKRILDRAMGLSARPEHAVLYAGMLVCLPGGVIFFQGDELGLRQGRLNEVKNSDPLGLTRSYMGENDASRAGMPWLDGINDELWLKPVASNKFLAPEIQGGQPDSSLAQIRELIRLRKDHPALQSSEPPLFPETHDPEVLAVLRRNREDGENMLCSFNFGHTPKRLQLRKGWDILTDIVCPSLGVVFASFIEDTMRSENDVQYTIYCAPPSRHRALTRLNRRAQLYVSAR